MAVAHRHAKMFNVNEDTTAAQMEAMRQEFYMFLHWKDLWIEHVDQGVITRHHRNWITQRMLYLEHCARTGDPVTSHHEYVRQMAADPARGFDSAVQCRCLQANCIGRIEEADA